MDAAVAERARVFGDGGRFGFSLAGDGVVGHGHVHDAGVASWKSPGLGCDAARGARARTFPAPSATSTGDVTAVWGTCLSSCEEVAAALAAAAPAESAPAESSLGEVDDTPAATVHFGNPQLLLRERRVRAWEASADLGGAVQA